jgi:SAM-dependent methyltransferase
MEITKLNLAEVNWSNIWEEGVLFFIGQAEKGNTWDQVANRWNKLCENDSEYRDKVLRRMRLRKNWTVLDAGCGTGLLAIPLAKKVKTVTGLDSSRKMLTFLKRNAASENLKNIEIVNKRFEEAVIGKDFEKHDVVIASRSIGHEHNLKSFLIALNNTAKRYAYLTWGASDRVFDIEFHKAIGREYGETRTYIIIYNLLYQLGIRANIEIFECSQKGMAYSSPDEATKILIKRYRGMQMGCELTRKEEIRLRKFLHETLIKTDENNFIFPTKPAKHALIWWKKEADLPTNNG